jgi:RHS repeat-associated protein
MNGSGTWTRGEVYAEGKHLATYGNGSSGTTYFVQADWLGTERTRLLPSGDLFETCTSLPFGDGLNCNGSADPSPNHLTGKQRDNETQLDYFGARYYSNGLGRFITPDWAAKATAVPYAEFADPQSLNLYAYVRNVPTTRFDADGHCPPGNINCKDVNVTAGPPVQKAPVANITVTDPKNGVTHWAGPIATVTGTVTVKGKTVDGVKVDETNQDKRTIGGKNYDQAPKIESNGVTHNGGHYEDNVGVAQKTDGSAQQNAQSAKFWNSTSTVSVNQQTITLTFSDGSTCISTSTRTITNVDSQGKLTDFTLTTTQPVVTPPR